MIKQEVQEAVLLIFPLYRLVPLSKVFTYSASKAGTNNVTQYLARELAPYNIRVNAIIPGFFPAEQNRKILSEEKLQTLCGIHLLNVLLIQMS